MFTAALGIIALGSVRRRRYPRARSLENYARGDRLRRPLIPMAQTRDSRGALRP